MRYLPNLLLGIIFISIASLHADDDERRVSVIRAATTVSQIRASSETVIRSAAKLEETAVDALLSKVLNLAEVDFEKQMEN